MTTASVETQTKNFRVEKSQFHQELVKNFTVGLALPQTILTQLEGFLTNVQSTINSSSDSHDNIQIFVYIMVYVNDDIAGTWRPCKSPISILHHENNTEPDLAPSQISGPSFSTRPGP